MLGLLKVSAFLLTLCVTLAHATASSPSQPIPQLIAQPIPQATRPQVITTGRPEPVPIAFIYRGAMADSPWAMSHELARKAVAAEFALRVETLAVERVDSASESDRGFRDLTRRGYKVFFATDALHADAAVRAAIPIAAEN